MVLRKGWKKKKKGVEGRQLADQGETLSPFMSGRAFCGQRGGSAGRASCVLFPSGALRCVCVSF